MHFSVFGSIWDTRETFHDVLFSSLTCCLGEAMDTELHQQILQIFAEESDEEDFLGFPASGMDEDSVVNLFTANNI